MAEWNEISFLFVIEMMQLTPKNPFFVRILKTKSRRFPLFSTSCQTSEETVVRDVYVFFPRPAICSYAKLCGIVLRLLVIYR